MNWKDKTNYRDYSYSWNKNSFFVFKYCKNNINMLQCNRTKLKILKI